MISRNAGGYWTTEIKPTKKYGSSKKVGDVRNELLTNAQNSGYGCVHPYFLLTFPFISKTAAGTMYTSRSLKEGKQKGNFSKMRRLLHAGNSRMFPNWVSFGVCGQAANSYVPSSKFLVYWSHTDIIAEIKMLNNDAHGQELEGKIAEVSNGVGAFFSWAVGNVGIHKHHLSLQNARDARDRRND